VKILFLTQVLPWPLDAGPKVRAYYVLRHLAQEHEVTLVSFVRESDRPEAIAHLRSLCRGVHTVPIRRSRVADARFLAESLLRGRSFILARDARPAMDRMLAKVLAEAGPFDAIHADQLWMAPFALRTADAAQQAPAQQAPAQQDSKQRTLRPLTVLDQHNACYRIFERLAESESNGLKRTILRREAAQLAHDEAVACARFDRVVWVTQEDADAVAAAAAEHKLPPPPVSAIIPICGDPAAERVVPRIAGSRRVSFLGGLHYPPNAEGVLWFARTILPRVLEQEPDALFTVIGKSPPEGLHRVGIPPANLQIVGYVDDPRPLLSETAVFVVPLLAGGGMRVKIIDGWTWGLPIVSTTVGAEGIALQEGVQILLADEPGAFADAVVRVLREPALRDRLASSGRAWAEERYGWRSVYRAWNGVYATPAHAETQS
jgi:glycosyltransferase involved in cell wall biosynthesis